MNQFIKLNPHGDFVLVMPINNLPTPKGRIIRPANEAGARPLLAQVLEVGPGGNAGNGARKLIDIKRGDYVLYPAGAMSFAVNESPLAVLLDPNDPLLDARFFHAPDLFAAPDRAAIQQLIAKAHADAAPAPKLVLAK